MDFINDILVNLLSDAIWAIGGYMLARILFLKKSKNPLRRKSIEGLMIRLPLLKKSTGCDLLSKKLAPVNIFNHQKNLISN